MYGFYLLSKKSTNKPTIEQLKELEGKTAIVTPDYKSIKDKIRGNLCEYCGTDKDISVDHKIPVSRGGTNDEDNLQALCRSCNEWKDDRTDAEARAILDAEDIMLYKLAGAAGLRVREKQRSWGQFIIFNENFSSRAMTYNRAISFIQGYLKGKTYNK